MQMEFIQIDGRYIPRYLYDQMRHEQAMGAKPDPERVAVAVNRALRRKMERAIRRGKTEVYHEGKIYNLEPINVPKPVSHSEAIDRVAAMLSEEMRKHTFPGTVETFKGVLDEAEAKIVEKAWRSGRPIPREQVREAIRRIYERGEAVRSRGR